MGRYTDEKHEYDRLAAEYFRSKGYIAEVTRGPGLADVVAYHPRTKRFVICEVKSPNEKDAHASWETKYNLGGMSRWQVLELISKEPGYKKNPGLWRLYAFTITSQLYTYCRQADRHLKAFLKQNRDVKPVANSLIVPYISYPLELRAFLRQVFRFFRGTGLEAGNSIKGNVKLGLTPLRMERSHDDKTGFAQKSL